MNIRVTDTVTSDRTVAETANRAAAQATANRKSRPAPKSKTACADNQDKTSKKDQLVALLSKPNGARVSIIAQRLGWQSHTVRAALSGLRKQGFEIATSTSSKNGETVYAIAARPTGKVGKIDGPAS